MIVLMILAIPLLVVFTLLHPVMTIMPALLTAVIAKVDVSTTLSNVVVTTIAFSQVVMLLQDAFALPFLHVMILVLVQQTIAILLPAHASIIQLIAMTTTHVPLIAVIQALDVSTL
jgi:hypothetical protein